MYRRCTSGVQEVCRMFKRGEQEVYKGCTGGVYDIVQDNLQFTVWKVYSCTECVNGVYCLRHLEALGVQEVYNGCT